MHRWAIGQRLGEFCCRCGWSRGAYELVTRDTSRDALRRYPQSSD